MSSSTPPPRRRRQRSEQRGPGRPMTCPPGVCNPLAHMNFQGSRYTIPERMPSARKEKVRVITVLDFNEETITNIKNVASTLKQLDLSGHELVEICDDWVEDLNVLERLDLSSNELCIDSFPDAMRNMGKLVDLSLQRNYLSNLPPIIAKMRSLTRLNLGDNDIETVAGIDKLKRSVILVMEHNKLKIFTKDFYANMKRLELLHCASNQLKEITSEIRNMRNLRDIDVSNNNLSLLPPELFLLPRIASINASNNAISRLPSITVKGKRRNRLAIIDLSVNEISRFPEHLLLMTDKLDLSSNKIKYIPGSFLRKLDYESEQDLVMMDNPLVVPPKDVCECGIKAIVQFFQEARSEMKVYQGLKVLVLGSVMSGKTSMIQSIVDQQSRLTPKNKRTIGVDVFETAIDLENDGPIGKDLQLTMWDFGGHSAYLYPSYYFLHQPSLVLVVFNLATYKPDKFYETIGYWLDWITVKYNKLVIIPVGTHLDKVVRSRAEETCMNVIDSINEHIENHKKAIRAEMDKIQGIDQIPKALTEQLKLYNRLLRYDTEIYSKPVAISSASLKGMDVLFRGIVEMTDNKDVFPQVMRVIPSMWVEVDNYIDDKGYAMPVPLVRWSDYEDEIIEKFGMKHLLKQITNYLHDIGRIIWFSDHPTLSNYVILRPAWFTELLKPIFRHDFDSIENIQDDIPKQSILAPSRFDKMKRDIRDMACVDRDGMRYLLSSAIPTEFSNHLVDMLQLLINDFEFAYIVDVFGEKPKEKKASRPDSSASKMSGKEDAAPPVAVTEAKKDPPRVARICFPWLLRNPRPTYFSQYYDAYKDFPCIVANYRFPQFHPPGLFEHLVVRAKNKFDLEVVFNWKGGIWARKEDMECRFYFLRITHSDNSTCFRIEVRQEKDVGLTEVEAMWGLMFPFIKELETLLGKYSGVRVERNMECPNCHSLSFLGEWLIPRDLQNTEVRMCENCKLDIPTVFLIQPKERKRVEAFLRKKLAAEEERQNRKSKRKDSDINKPDVKKEQDQKPAEGVKVREDNSEKTDPQSTLTSTESRPKTPATPTSPRHARVNDGAEQLPSKDSFTKQHGNGTGNEAPTENGNNHVINADGDGDGEVGSLTDVEVDDKRTENQRETQSDSTRKINSGSPKETEAKDQLETNSDSPIDVELVQTEQTNANSKEASKHHSTKTTPPTDQSLPIELPNEDTASCERNGASSPNGISTQSDRTRGSYTRDIDNKLIKRDIPTDYIPVTTTK